MFGVQAQVYQMAAKVQGGRSSDEFLPAALLGLHPKGVTALPPNEHEALFAWGAIDGALWVGCTAALRIHWALGEGVCDGLPLVEQRF